MKRILSFVFFSLAIVAFPVSASAALDPQPCTIDPGGICPLTPPAFSGPTSVSGIVGVPIQFTVTASSPDGAPLTISSALPSGATYDSVSGTFDWIPAQPGTYAADFSADDGQSTIPFTVTIDVSTPPQDLPPFFTNMPGPGNATATVLYSYDVDATDPEGRPVSFSLDATSPQGMTIDPATGLIQWTPTALQATTTPYAVTTQVSDAVNVATTTFSIVVAPVSGTGGGGGGTNLPPFFTNFPPSGTATATILYSYDLDATDPEGRPVSFSLQNEPQGITIDPATGLIQWTPTSAQATSTPYSIIALVSDAVNVVSSTFTIAVNASSSGTGGGGGTNLPPNFTNFNPGTSTIATTQYLYDADAIDPEGAPLSFSLTTAPQGMTIATSTGLIQWVPTLTQVSSTPYSVTVQVSDGVNATSTTYAITVSAPPAGQDLPPFFTNMPGPGNATATVLYSYDVDATDPEGRPVSFSLDATSPQGMTIDPATGLIQWTPTALQATTTPYTVTVGVNDGVNIVTSSYTIAVNPQQITGGGDGSGGGGGSGGGSGGGGPSIGGGGISNFGPNLVNFTPPTVAAANQLYSYDVEAQDPDGDVLKFRLSVAPPGMTIDPATGLIQWTPTTAQIRTNPPYMVELEVTDGINTIRQIYQITVVDQLPSGGGIGAPTAPISFTNFNPPTTATVDMLYLYDAEAQSVTGQPLTFALLQNPSGMLILSTNGLINWTPTADQVAGSPYLVTVQVSDGTNATTTSYTVAVNPITQQAATTSVIPTAPSEALPAPEEELPSANTIDNFSISTTTTNEAEVSADAGNRIFSAALLTGVFKNLLAALRDWIKNYYSILGYILWLITLAAFIFYIVFSKEGEENEAKKDDSQNIMHELGDGTMEIVPEDGFTPLDTLDVAPEKPFG